MAGDNVVNWGLKASAWAEISTDANGNDIYSAPHKFRGLRSINFTPNGDVQKVYADGTTVYIGRTNDGYAGTMEFTNPDEDFLSYVLGESVDTNGLQYEIVEPEVKRVALLWEWVGDQKNARHCMYNCIITRPDLSAITKGDGGTKTAQYQTLNIQSLPRANDDVVKIRTRSDTKAATYNNWFSTVPVVAAAATQIVTVTVKASSKAVPGALVQLSNGMQGVTDAAGVIIFMMESGTYSMSVSKTGYTAKLDSVTVSTAAVSKSITLTAA